MKHALSTREKVLLSIWCTLLVLIWGNSLLPSEQSSAMSEALGGFLKSIFGVTDGEIAPALSSFPLRKAAHFTEFALLGIFTVLLGLCKQPYKPVWPNIALTGLAVAFVDESIQLFSAGRAPMVTDMWIDLAGFAVGTLMTQWICIGILRKRHCKKRN